MTQEIWKDAPFGWGASYLVSNLGNIFSKKTNKNLKPMRTGDNGPGRKRSKVRFNSAPRVDFDVANLVLTAFIGPRQEGFVAMHLDDDSANNKIGNLIWGTHKDNAVDCAKKCRGGSQLLGVDEVKEIYRRRCLGESGASIARGFNISQQRVCDIYKGRTVLL